MLDKRRSRLLLLSFIGFAFLGVLIECTAELYFLREGRQVSTAQYTLNDNLVQYDLYRISFQKRIGWFDIAPRNKIYLFVEYSARCLENRSQGCRVKQLAVIDSHGTKYLPDLQATRRYDLKFCSEYPHEVKPVSDIPNLPAQNLEPEGWENLYAVYQLPMSELPHDPKICAEEANSSTEESPLK